MGTQVDWIDYIKAKRKLLKALFEQHSISAKWRMNLNQGYVRTHPLFVHFTHKPMATGPEVYESPEGAIPAKVKVAELNEVSEFITQFAEDNLFRIRGGMEAVPGKLYYNLSPMKREIVKQVQAGAIVLSEL
jgi:hypothetical protein